MNIVHIVSYFSDRYRYQEYYLAKQQVIEGHSVTIITSDLNYPFPDYRNTSLNIYGKRKMKSGEYFIEGFKVIRLPVIVEFRTRVALKGLKKSLKSIKPDFIQIHGLLNFFTIQILSIKTTARLVFDEHMLVKQLDKSVFGKFVYFLFREILILSLIKRAEKIVAISEGCIPTLTHSFGVPLDKVTFIPLGADIDLFKYDSIKRQELRHKLGISLNEIVLIYTGKVIKSKGPHKIIEGLKDINTQKKIVVLIVGNGPDDYKNELKKLAKSFKIKCILYPHVTPEELPNLFSAADIAVYPSEATISTIEASSCGLPIICTNEIPERYKNNNGIGIHSDDEFQLRNAMVTLINDDDLRNLMGKNGREYVEKELSWRVLSNKFLEMI